MKTNKFKADPIGSINRLMKVHEIIASSNLLLNSQIASFFTLGKDGVRRDVMVEVDMDSLFHQGKDAIYGAGVDENTMSVNTESITSSFDIECQIDDNFRRINPHLCPFIQYVLACCGWIDDSFLPLTMTSFTKEELESTFRLFQDGENVRLCGPIHKKRDIVNGLTHINSILDKTIAYLQNELIFRGRKYSEPVCIGNTLVTELNDFKQVNTELINSILQHPKFNINPVDFAYLIAFIDLANLLALQYYERVCHWIHRSPVAYKNIVDGYVQDELKSKRLWKGLDRLTYYMLQALMCSPKHPTTCFDCVPSVDVHEGLELKQSYELYESDVLKTSLFYDVNEDKCLRRKSRLSLKDLGKPSSSVLAHPLLTHPYAVTMQMHSAKFRRPVRSIHVQEAIEALIKVDNDSYEEYIECEGDYD